MLIYPIAALGLIGLIFGLILATAAKIFAVETDPKIEEIKNIVPGANCGACGYAGCAKFAEAVVHGDVEPGGCIPGGEDVTNEIGRVLGIEVSGEASPIATVFCIGDIYKTTDRFIYDGVKDCAISERMYGGHKGCAYGCLGFGNCARVCPFDAIRMGTHGLPIIDVEKCTGCGLCVKECPRDLIQLLPPGNNGHLALCTSQDRGKAVSKVCEVGCIACKACVKACPVDAIEMEGKLAVINLEKCDDCGDCFEACPPVTIHPRSAIPSEKEAEEAAAAPKEVSESA